MDPVEVFTIPQSFRVCAIALQFRLLVISAIAREKKPYCPLWLYYKPDLLYGGKERCEEVCVIAGGGVVQNGCHPLQSHTRVNVPSAHAPIGVKLMGDIVYTENRPVPSKIFLHFFFLFLFNKLFIRK